MANKDGGGFLEIGWTWGTSFDFHVPKETKSSWRFLFLPPSWSPDTAGGGDYVKSVPFKQCPHTSPPRLSMASGALGSEEASSTTRGPSFESGGRKAKEG
jgi:hypothetical protein